MKVLVVIASYGNQNDVHLRRLLDEYLSMPYEMSVVVLTNVPKDLGRGIDVVVESPYKNPFAFPFAHKRIFADGSDTYDLFIYSEDDILITKRNIDAFLQVTAILPDDEIAGFLRVERDSEGRTHYIDAHSIYHWDPGSVRSRGEFIFAFFTNEHAASYVLTQSQLRRAIKSGGFIVGPHEENYELRETAATDPYTQCGFKKMICISHLDDFTILHLPNKKHKGRPYGEKSEFYKQVDSLLQIQNNRHPKTLLFDTDPRVGQGRWSKSYYEPYEPFAGFQATRDITSCVPSCARSVLSIGCGWASAEGALVKSGIRVVGVPLDSVIAASAKARGVEIIYGPFDSARRELAGNHFDCILMSYVLHLVRNPFNVLSSFAELLSPQGTIILTVPNFSSAIVAWRRIRRDSQYKDFGSYEKTGTHTLKREVIRTWLQRCDLKIEKTLNIVSRRADSLHRMSLGLAGPLLSSDFVIIGKKS